MPSKSRRGKQEFLQEQSSEEMEEIKKSLHFMSAELANLTSQQELLIRLFEEVKQL